MVDFLDELTNLATSLSLNKLPSSVVHRGRRILVDTVGVILGGMKEESPRLLAGTMAEASATASSTILGSRYRADAMWAAMAHGTAGTWHEFDAGHRFVDGNPAIYAISAGLAVAEREQCSGRRLLEAVIAGYEVGTRVGLGTILRPGLTAHGSWPLVASAAAAGLLMGYQSDRLREVINVSTSLNVASSSKSAYDGATIYSHYAGFGSAMGVLAADLVKDGFTGERDGVTTVFGNIAGLYFDDEKCLEGIGQHWEIERGYYKLHSCARDVHPALDALIEATKDEDVSPEAIERIEVKTYAIAATMNNVAPENQLVAKFSIPHALASYLVLKDTGVGAFDEGSVVDPRIRSLAARVSVNTHWEMDARTPAERPAIVKVVFKNGEMLEGRVRLPLGEEDVTPCSDEALTRKFLSLAAGCLDSETSARLLETLWHVEELKNVREIMSLGIRHSG